MLFESIDEIYDDLILLLDKNQTKILEDTNLISISIPLESVKIKEILFVLNICFLTENYYKFGHINKNKYKDGSFIRIVLEIAEMCNYLGYSSDQIVNICVEMKTILKNRNVNEKINSMFFQELFYYLKNLYLMSYFNKINNNDNIDYFKIYKQFDLKNGR